MRFTLFIPIRYEIGRLRVIMPRIDRAWVGEILLIDGGSSDGSREYLLSIGFDLVEQTISGIKTAFWKAFEIATGPEDIPRLIDKMKVGYDIAKASRYLPPATSQEDDFASKLVNRW